MPARTTHQLLALTFVGFGLSAALFAVPWQLFWGAGFKGMPSKNTWQLLAEYRHDPVMGLLIFGPHLVALGCLALAAILAWRARAHRA